MEVQTGVIRGERVTERLGKRKSVEAQKAGMLRKKKREK